MTSPGDRPSSRLDGDLWRASPLGLAGPPGFRAVAKAGGYYLPLSKYHLQLPASFNALGSGLRLVKGRQQIGSLSGVTQAFSGIGFPQRQPDDDRWCAVFTGTPARPGVVVVGGPFAPVRAVAELYFAHLGPESGLERLEAFMGLFSALASLGFVGVIGRPQPNGALSVAQLVQLRAAGFRTMTDVLSETRRSQGG